MHRGKVGFFASDRIVAHRNDPCNYFERFHGLLYGIWTHVAKLKEIVLDIKKNLYPTKAIVKDAQKISWILVNLFYCEWSCGRL